MKPLRRHPQANDYLHSENIQNQKKHKATCEKNRNKRKKRKKS